LFCAFQLWGTGISEAHSQQKLRTSLRQVLAQPAPPANLPFPAPPAGEAVAAIRIPKIGVDQAVVEGTGVSDLRKGPGHYRGSSLPGQHGNVAIAGHRTTYGAPFNRLDELDVNDTILVSGRSGQVRYAVTEKRIVSPRSSRVVNDFGDDRLTLTTCNPKFSAAERLIVVAHPVDDPATSASLTPAAAPLAAAPDRRIHRDLALSGNSGAWLPLLAWAALAIALRWGYRRLAQRWSQASAHALITPAFLVVLLALFETLNQLLPANI